VKFDLIIVRYAEIALKAKQTRRRFESTLVNNIKNALKTKNIQNSLSKEWGRIYVYSDQIEKCLDVLKNIFGVYSISPAIQTESKIEEISKGKKINKEEKIIFDNTEKLREYFFYFYDELFYKDSEKSIEKIDKLAELSFDFNRIKSRSDIDIMIELYKMFEKSLYFKTKK